MSSPFEEILEGVTLQRPAPGRRHELICARLHDVLRASVANLASARLLTPREPVALANHTTVRPDAALVTTANNRLWLAVEIVSSDDHRVDTVVKKQIYENFRLPRLWMIDPRYDNVEIYHATQYGLTLKAILAGRESVTEQLLPEFHLVVADLFAD
ncbi:MAG TPA: Uma2 family endonuclease [Verrucomicrobia bacterium]|nr:Uma2 family endonuclease [Verrucomicrobiota bacterium]HOB33023.1 Uma2 family endonuclease [Verrucomicrobiota bacterium]HOP97105.1 Uma2 family endonuclease [Verrucomicrobiota bacterium]HPU55009.1 Uma2 family endonuclease [Verrucomicrobiota bacterium]